MKRAPLWLLLGVAFLVPAHPSSAAGDGKRMDPQRVALTADLATLSKRDVPWRVYTLATPRVSPAAFGALVGQLLGQQPFKGKVGVLDDRLQYRDPKDASLYCTQDRASGRLSLTKSLKEYLGEQVPELPEPEAAQRIATEFLRKSRLAPKNDAELKTIHAGGLRMTSVKEGKGGPIIDKLRTVVFGRLLDGVPVHGSGSKIVVHVGNHGDVVGIDRRWREVAAARTVGREEWKDPRQTGEEIRKLLATEWNEAKEIAVSRVEALYYDRDGRYIQPAYVFEATITEGDSRYQYLGAIPALKRAPERIGPAAIPPEARQLLLRPKGAKVNKKTQE